MSWEKIISETIKNVVEESGKAVPGAAFKKLLTDVAEEPLPDVKFSEFLKKYTEQITVIPRCGSDILIIPKGRIDLVEEGDATVKVRRDFFKAFSTIALSKKYWYSKDKDYAQPFEKDFKPGESNILIPECTEESEIALRRDYADSIDDEKIKAGLIESLGKNVPMSAFAVAVRKLNLVDGWYNYRIENIIERIRQWSKDSNLTWRESWVSSKESFSYPSGSDSTRNYLDRAIKSLSDSDLARITVPLDIVIKLLKSK